MKFYIWFQDILIRPFSVWYRNQMKTLFIHGPAWNSQGTFLGPVRDYTSTLEIVNRRIHISHFLAISSAAHTYSTCVWHTNKLQNLAPPSYVTIRGPCGTPIVPTWSVYKLFTRAGRDKKIVWRRVGAPKFSSKQSRNSHEGPGIITWYDWGRIDHLAR